MDLLARREHGYQELRRKLSRRFSVDELEEALDRLREENLQSDQRFARVFTRERMLRGYGPQRIEAELRQRGVSRAIAEDAIREVPRQEGQSWRELAIQVLQRKFGGEAAESFEERARRARFLAYRGFGEGDAPDVLRDFAGD